MLLFLAIGCPGDCPECEVDRMALALVKSDGSTLTSEQTLADGEALYLGDDSQGARKRAESVRPRGPNPTHGAPAVETAVAARCASDEAPFGRARSVARDNRGDAERRVCCSDRRGQGNRLVWSVERLRSCGEM